MKNILIVALLLSVGIACTGCSNDSGDDQAQQTQIKVLQSQLSAVQTQLSSAKTEASLYNTGINTAITSLTHTQGALAQLSTQPESSGKTVLLTTAGNQILVLQTLADSLTSKTADVCTAYTNSKTRLATLTEQLNTANAQVASLTSQLAAEQNNNTTLASQLSDANAKVTTITGQIATLNSAVASLQTQLDAANGTIAADNTAISNKTATIDALNNSITGLNATISAMIATPVPMSVSSLAASVSTGITVTATFDPSQQGKTATFTATGGNLLATPASVTIAGNGTATTTFSSASTGTFNINVVEGLYTGGGIVTITAVPTPTFSCSGTLSTLGRWCDNGNGTVRDMTTGLLWLQDANCVDTLGGVTTGTGNKWDDAMFWSSNLADGTCSLSDDSVAGDWRLPTINDFKTLTSGTEPVQSGTPHLFGNIRSDYWSSSPFDTSGNIFAITMITAGIYNSSDSSHFSVWPVRDGQ